MVAKMDSSRCQRVCICFAGWVDGRGGRLTLGTRRQLARISAPTHMWVWPVWEVYMRRLEDKLGSVLNWPREEWVRVLKETSSKTTETNEYEDDKIYEQTTDFHEAVPKLTKIKQTSRPCPITKPKPTEETSAEYVSKMLIHCRVERWSPEALPFIILLLALRLHVIITITYCIRNEENIKLCICPAARIWLINPFGTRGSLRERPSQRQDKLN